MRDTVAIENAGGNCSACVPGLPGRMATGPAAQPAETGVSAAIRCHIEGLPVRAPSARAEYARA